MKPSETQVGGSHYKKQKIQPHEYSHQNNLGWHQGEVVKYITRFRDKGGKQDLEKAAHVIQLLIEVEYPEPKPEHIGSITGICTVHVGHHDYTDACAGWFPLLV